MNVQAHKIKNIFQYSFIKVDIKNSEEICVIINKSILIKFREIINVLKIK